ncbi:MAG TPA: hypothetical protein VNN12_02560 [Dehalococcoidia bacterium]|nr:hypothetical protein [Dehalococcoidia bacterium]
MNSSERLQVLTEANQEELRRQYVERLRRLLRLRRRHLDDLNEQGILLLDRSIFAAYRECATVNALEEAKAVLAEERLMQRAARAREASSGRASAA